MSAPLIPRRYWAIAFLVVIRCADGLLLYKLTTLTQTQTKTPVVQHSG